MSTSFARLVVLFMSALAIASPAAALTTADSGLYSRTGTVCAPGTYSSNGRSPCYKCPAGYYQSNSGSTSCVAASAGHYAAGEGCTNHTPCPSGHYCSTSGSSSCTAASPGYKASGTACTSQERCPAGKFTGISGATECCTCPAGWYSTSDGASSCQQCPSTSNYRIGYCSAGSTTPSACKNQAGALSNANHNSDGTCPVTSTPVPSSNAHKRNLPLAKQCRPGWKSCPVYTGLGAAATLTSYECVNVASDLESCGGCVNAANPLASSDGGRDCSAIPNADTVSCINSACIIEACKVGFALSVNGQNCEASSAHRRRIQVRGHML